MRGVILYSFLLPIHCVSAQDSSQVAPKWAFDLFVGGGGAEHITVALGPDDEGSIALAGWFNLGVDAERRIEGCWSARGRLTYERAGWQGAGGNMFATPSDQGDRWALALGAVHQLYRGSRSQFTVQGGARLTMGMDVQAALQLDALFTAGTFQQAALHYKPAVSPVADLTWRWRTARQGPLGLCASLGIERYHSTYDHADLSSGMSELPTELAPLTGAHSGWAWTFTFGLYVWP